MTEVKIPDTLPLHERGTEIRDNNGEIAAIANGNMRTYIVRAANAYPALVEALRPFAEACEMYEEDEYYSAINDISIDDLKRARAALKAAGVEP